MEALDASNSTPLHLCSAAGQDPSFLIQKGANVGAFSDKGLGIIHTAAAGGRYIKREDERGVRETLNAWDLNSIAVYAVWRRSWSCALTTSMLKPR